MSIADNEKMRVLALIAQARDLMLDGKIPEADATLQNLLHGEINESTVPKPLIDRTIFEREFKALQVETGVQAMWLARFETVEIGVYELRAGGDGHLMKEFLPKLLGHK